MILLVQFAIWKKNKHKHIHERRKLWTNVNRLVSARCDVFLKTSLCANETGFMGYLKKSPPQV